MEEILKIFRQIAKIPRTSKNEEKIRKWLVSYGQQKGWQVEVDEVGNVLMRVKATLGKEKKEGIVLQTHMDMVGEKWAEVKHDFTKDPIEVEEKNGWLRAKGGTTLGADDGIGMAIALYVAEHLPHPPLELLFTVDEETGLTGAQALKEDWLRFKQLINLDSEDMGIITIGCAGSMDVSGEKRVITKTVDGKGWQIKLVGGKGGHSGVEIDKKIANAHKLLARMLKGLKLNIVKWQGGKVRNAIPSQAEVIFVSEINAEEIEERLTKLRTEIEKEWCEAEPNLKIKWQKVDLGEAVELTETESERLIALIESIPHGVWCMSKTVEGLVETSNNLAIVKADAETGKAKIDCMARSMEETGLKEIVREIEVKIKEWGGKVERGNTSPAWKPEPTSRLLQKVKTAHEQVFDKPAKVEAIHAGLECGVILEKYPGMEAVSIGPTIKGAHTPEERVEVRSIGEMVEWMKRLCLL